ncbi:hypothetical protein GWK47_018961 [Chionoecetes opilio]|uniref:Uncharacterized protein n=1 Tax=Chionoecetes opilio TaxID=41210 RepID=A0A8J4XR70_CHIOP|nr:hypothetical protein GWK47_018961 [Chionoecetes opilio]
MEAVLSVIFVYVCVCVHAVKSQAEYDTYNLDSFKLCEHKDSGSIYIRPWKAAILTFGNPPGSELPPPGRDIHDCTVTIKTQENFGMAAVIENMSIAATLNKMTHAWECDGDHLKVEHQELVFSLCQISTFGTSTISKILSLLPGDYLRSKKTQELCGVRKGKPR